ncbi:M6 family metalloprotease domain-containing protein [Phragmitibacter flavus]|nr:M6 family metalloprotease domain-containing protein [Phragmitibacter flavus]
MKSVLAGMLAAVALGLSFSTLHAVSASGGESEFLQPDGQKVRLRNAGDEWFHWHETPEGYVVAKDDDGFWKYSQPKLSSAELEPLRHAVVGRVNPGSLGLQKRSLPGRNLIRDQVQALKGKGRSPRRAVKLDELLERSRVGVPTSGSGGNPSSGANPSAASPAAEPQPGGQEAPVGSGPTGPWGRTVKCVVILAAFSDHWDNVNNKVQDAEGRPRGEFIDLFNKTGYSVGGAIGSVKDFYLENSYGEMTIESEVTIWVKLPQTQAWYGDNAHEIAGEQRLKQLALDAINAADAAGFDFSQSDADGDGFVDLLHVIYSGHSEAWSGNPSTAIWPRQWQLEDSITRDGLQLNLFSTSEAIKGSVATSTSIATIGVICHEIGHQFGLPDLYDTSLEYQGVGTWCCMGYGCWGAGSSPGDGRQPVNFSAHCRHLMGFIKPLAVFGSERIDLPDINTNAAAHLVVPMTGTYQQNHEYFLVENRRRVGFDSQLPGDGILIWHILSSEWDNDSSEAVHPAVRLEEAAGGDTLATSRYATAAHLWHGANGLVGGFTDTTGSENTNAMRYQGGRYYTRINSSGSHSKIRMRNFSAASAVMSYDLQTVVPTVLPQSVASANYAVSWNVSSDATAYELQQGIAGTTNLFLDDTESKETFWRSWTTTGLVLRSDAGAFFGSHSYRMAPWDDDVVNFMAGPHSMQLNQDFVLTPTSLISFYVLSHVVVGSGYLSVELSKDGGLTWISIDKIAGYQDSWTAKSYSFASLATKGFVSGDRCLLRLATRMGEVWGWSGYPSYGFAVDYIRMSGIQMPTYHSWAIASYASSAINNRLISNKPVGTYAYRARAMVGGNWQSYSDPVVIERLPTPFETWAAALPAGQRGMLQDADQDGVTNSMEYAFGRQGSSNTAPHDVTQLPVVGSAVFSGGKRLTITLDLPEAPPAEAVYEVQVADDLDVDSWATILSKTGGSDWTGGASVTFEPQAGQRTKFTIYDVVRIDDALLGRRFMRLKVRVPP